MCHQPSKRKKNCHIKPNQYLTLSWFLCCFYVKYDWLSSPAQIQLRRECSLAELMDQETCMVKQIRSLDSDMQTLVYENYNKFISATGEGMLNVVCSNKDPLNVTAFFLSYTNY